MKKIFIKADTNDADFISKVSDLKEEDVALVSKVAEAIGKVPGHNWDTSYEDHREKDSPNILYEGILSEKEIEAFNELVPSSEYGIHTIYNITILEVTSEQELLR